MTRPCSWSQVSGTVPGSKPWAYRLRWFIHILVAMSSVQPCTTHISLCPWVCVVCRGSGTRLGSDVNFCCETDNEDGSCEGGSTLDAVVLEPRKVMTFEFLIVKLFIKR